VIHWHSPDPRHQQLELQNVVAEAALVLVLQHILGRSLLKRAKWSDAIDLGLTRFFHQSYEIPLRFLEPSCASALANAPPANVLAPMPDAASLDESRHFLASHDSPPFDRPGRPLRDHPGIKFKAIEADTLLADRYFGQVRAHLDINAVAVHPEVAGRLTEAN